MTTLKTCTRCGKAKPADTAHFHPHGGKRAGRLNAACRECRDAYNRMCYHIRRNARLASRMRAVRSEVS